MTEKERERLIAFKDWLNREDYGDVEQLERCWNQAATRMRDACVEKVIEHFGGLTSMCVHRDDLVTELQSLTLDQTQQKNQP